jgi:hypothetical protein
MAATVVKPNPYPGARSGEADVPLGVPRVGVSSFWGYTPTRPVPRSGAGPAPLGAVTAAFQPESAIAFLPRSAITSGARSSVCVAICHSCPNGSATLP